MLEIVLTPEILDPPKVGALGCSLFSLMVNPRLGQRQLLLPYAWKPLTCVACLVFPFSLIWPTLLTCSGRASATATSLSFLEVFGLPTLFELSCQESRQFIVRLKLFSKWELSIGLNFKSNVLSMQIHCFKKTFSPI